LSLPSLCFPPIVLAVHVRPPLPQALAAALEALQHVLGGLDQHLVHNTFLAGNRVTAADAVAAVTLAPLFATVLQGPTQQQTVPSLSRWFLTVKHQPQVQSVLAAGAVAGAEPKAKPKQGPKGGKGAQGPKGGEKEAKDAGKGKGAGKAGGKAAGAGAAGAGAGAGAGGAGVSTGAASGLVEHAGDLFRRKRMRVKEILAGDASLVGSVLTVCGWVKTARDQVRSCPPFCVQPLVLVADVGRCRRAGCACVRGAWGGAWAGWTESCACC
jgi:hypothetical protein